MATSHSSGSPTNFSGRVASSASKSVSPKARRMRRTKASSEVSSPASWSGATKMWASSWVMPRTRVRPWSTPERSKRYTVPSSNSRSGSSRYDRACDL